MAVVLVVDDEPGNLSTFARCFRREHQVKTAGSAREALAVLEQGGVEVLVTDQTMPLVTGVELLKAASARWPHLARLVLSGHEGLPELLRARRDGLAHEVLSKPWEKGEVLSAIERALRVVAGEEGH